MSLNHLPAKVVLMPTKRSIQSRRAWAACEQVTVKFSGIRSDVATTAVHSIYTNLDGSRILIGQLNYFGANQKNGAGRNFSFLLNKKRLGLPLEVGYATPFVLVIDSNKSDIEGSNPSFAEVSVWCADT